MKFLDYLKKYSLFTLLAVGVLFTTGCGDDDEAPEPENELEVITDVKLIFTNTMDANDVVEASAQDPDGMGVQELQILGSIDLDVNKTYTLTYEILNNLETPGEDIGAEIQDEDDEHQFFYSFSDGAFASPTGNGNIDTASDPINYGDMDGNGNPLGYTTTWTTSGTALNAGTFTARLQHQPGEKTSTSGANDGDSDFDLEFVLNIQ
ncbi:MAG: GTP cyclohydrolase [Bacteroidota bacterium]